MAMELNVCLSQVAQSMVSGNHWLSCIKIYTAVIWLHGALGYKMHPKLERVRMSGSQKESFVKILCYKMHH